MEGNQRYSPAQAKSGGGKVPPPLFCSHWNMSAKRATGSGLWNRLLRAILPTAVAADATEAVTTSSTALSKARLRHANAWPHPAQERQRPDLKAYRTSTVWRRLPGRGPNEFVNGQRLTFALTYTSLSSSALGADFAFAGN